MSVRKLLLLVVLCTPFALLGRGIRDAREAARQSQCAGVCSQLLVALHNYHSQYNALPPACIADSSGKPMHSWRVLLLPFMEETTLYARYDFGEPWNGPNNIKLLNSMPSSFACPSRSSNSTNLTGYVAVTGPGTMFPGSRSSKFDDVTDGLSNTLMIVEVANANIPWTAPVDLDIRTMSFQINDPKHPAISSSHPGGANVGVADGYYRWLPNSVTPANLRTLLTAAGGEGPVWP